MEKINLLVRLLALALFTNGLIAKAQELSLQGSYTETVYLNGMASNLAPVYFTVAMKGCQWKIRCNQDKGPYSPDYTEATYDGTNIYFILDISNAVQSQIKKGVEMAANIANATVYKTEVCNMEEAYDISPVWLAYASGCYFSTQTNDYVEPAFHRDPASAMRFGPPTYYKMQARWTLTNSTFSFLSQLAYLSDGRKMNIRGQYVNRPAPYDHGFTNSYYQVDSFTAISSLIVPVAAEFKMLILKIQATNSLELEKLREYHFKTTWITNRVEDIIFQPKIPGITFVEDFRPIEPDHKRVDYNATNKWPSLEEIQKIKFGHELDYGSKNVSSRAVPIKFVRILLLTLLVAPIIIWGVCWIKGKRKSKN